MDGDRAKKPATSSSGPKACKACAAGKAKCIFMPEASATNGKCSRCYRLNKLCLMQTAAVRSRRKIHSSSVTPSEARGASQLDASQQVSKSSNTPYSTAIDDSFLPIGSPEYPVSVSTSSQYAGTPQSHQSAPGLSTANSANSVGSALDLKDPEALLGFYQKSIADSFPFVVIPQHITAYSLLRDKPLLFKSIVMVASVQNAKAQSAAAEEVLEYLSLHLLLRAEKSLDLLQGVLVFVAWNHAHIHLGRRFFILLQLAEALSADLGLNCEPPVLMPGEMRHEFWTYPQDIPAPSKRTLEERRAFLGLAYLNSITSMHGVYREILAYRKYTENCVEIIRDFQELPSDQYLLQLMKLESITREINDTLPRERLDLSPISGNAAVCIKNIQNKLCVFEERVPIHLRGNPYLLAQYHGILVYLTETALFTPSLPSRTATLHACMTSIISFFSALFSIPTMEYYKVIYPVWQQMMYSFGVLSKLSLLESDDWDLSHVGRMVDLSIVLDGMLDRFEEVTRLRQRLTGLDGRTPSSDGSDEGIFGKLIPKLRQHKETFERRREDISRRAAPAPLLPPSTFPMSSGPELQIMASSMPEMLFNTHIPDNHFDMSQVNFNQLDDTFWSDFIGDYGIVLS